MTEGSYLFHLNIPSKRALSVQVAAKISLLALYALYIHLFRGPWRYTAKSFDATQPKQHDCNNIPVSGDTKIWNAYVSFPNKERSAEG
jgi:hypothetical protein